MSLQADAEIRGGPYSLSLRGPMIAVTLSNVCYIPIWLHYDALSLHRYLENLASNFPLFPLRIPFSFLTIEPEAFEMPFF